MNTAKHATQRETKRQASLRGPLAGAGLVFRRQMRSRNVWRDVGGSIGVLAFVLGLAYGWQGPIGGREWLLRSVLGLLLLSLAFAAVAGAQCVPKREEAEATQSLLLTRLRPLEICMGRLLAALWPLLLILSVSGLFWLARTGAGPIESVTAGAIVEAHGLMACAAFAVASLAQLFAWRSRPGQAWGVGVAATLISVALTCTLIVLLNPVIRRRDDPTPLIRNALVVNPVSAVATVLKFDILRTQWLYHRSDAHDYPFLYPSPLASASLFTGVGVAALSLSAWRLRRAYR